MNIANAADQTTQVAIKSGILHDVLQASIFVQLLLLSLFVFSVISWAIILAKHFQFKKINELNTKFDNEFWKTDKLETLYKNLNDYEGSPIAEMFKNAYKTLIGFNEKTDKTFAIDSAERSLRKTLDIEVTKMENQLPFLATIGSTAPFIGLLGTVVGIMTSFRDIYEAGSASLATVAPGISEALFATAVGLVAAIPAVMAYNHFLNKLNKVELSLSGFTSDFINKARHLKLKD